MQMVLLASAVFLASISSIGSSFAVTFSSLLIGVLLVVALVRVERSAAERMFPRDALSFRSEFAPLYAMLGLLSLATASSQIFVPLFLQRIHGQSPFQAGYMAALGSIGWSAAALWTASRKGAMQRVIVRSGPLVTLIGLASLAFLMPLSSTGSFSLLDASIAVSLLATGTGLGLSNPHIMTRILAVATHEDADSAASAISTVRLCSVALGSAIAGLVVNVAGASSPIGVFDAGNAARWLFAFSAIPSLACLTLVWRKWR